MKFLISYKFKIIAALVILFYLVFCQSCARMRMSQKETKVFFNYPKINYIDSTIAVDEQQIHFIETGKKDQPTLFFVHGSPGSWDAYKTYLKDSLLLKKYRMIAVDVINNDDSRQGSICSVPVFSNWPTGSIQRPPGLDTTGV